MLVHRHDIAETTIERPFLINGSPTRGLAREL
jgi:hypothetical protein